LADKAVTALAAHGLTSLALCADGTVVGWGYNSNGDLGTGGSTSSTATVAAANAGVLAGRAVTHIAMGNRFGLTLCADGTLASWGWNFDGQLGDGLRDTLWPA
jgi:alpha-tubulin suppressor-like RCC1 family protein